MPLQFWSLNTASPSFAKTLLALAAAQLLLACAPVPKPQFTSHFSPEQNQYYSSEAAESQSQSATAEDADSGERMIVGSGKVIAPPKKPYSPERGQAVTLNLEDVPVAQLVRTVLGDILSVDYVLHPPIAGNVTLATRKPVKPDEALNLMEIALQANGLAMVRDTRGTYHIGQVDALRSLGATVRVASGSTTLAPGFGAIVVPLQYIGAQEMANILRPMAHDGAIVRVDSLRNLLVLSGTRAQAEGWLDVVRTFDVDLLEGMSVGVFPLKYLTIEEVSAALQIVGGASAAGSPTPAAPAQPQRRGTAAQQAQAAGGGMASLANTPLSGALHILPLERMSSILVITPNPAYLNQVKRWIAKFDQPGGEGGQAQLHIYQVQNGNAKHLAEVLSGIFGGSTTGTSTSNSGVAPGLGSSQARTTLGQNSLGTGLRPGGLTGGGLLGTPANPSANAPSGVGSITDLGGIRVMADELNNSVIVWGTAAEYERIESALKRLDVPPTQVLIEASIIEVTLNDSLRYGLEWSFNGGGGGGGRSGSGQLSNSGNPLADALGAGFSYTVRNSAGNVRAVLNALSSKTNLKVVASPTLMVLDNHTATINVGTQQPYEAGQTINSDGRLVSSNLQYKDTGVSLEVTPSVNSGNLVTMTVNQAVTDVGAKDDVTQQRSFLQRQVSSRVAVRSGESIVMGGLIQETTSRGRSGIPLLHDIPVVGSLFGSNNTDGARTELIVIITPRVVRTDVDVQEVGDSLRQHMGQLSGLLAPVHPGQAPVAAPDQLQYAPVPPTELLQRDHISLQPLSLSLGAQSLAVPQPSATHQALPGRATTLEPEQQPAAATPAVPAGLRLEPQITIPSGRSDH